MYYKLIIQYIIILLNKSYTLKKVMQFRKTTTF
jgi:hypothetical protein